MSRSQKIYEAVFNKASSKNIRLEELCTLLENLGFNTRVRGSHHIFYQAGC